ncbi:MAG TPA: pirin family protein [Gammaproteobacteria bacterium]|nr:pirin family protein [Gammaproteobacteria bacterium]
MSTLPDFEPICKGQGGAVELTIEPRVRDLGGFTVRRVLPCASRRMVGPFIFFDEMGPVTLPPGRGFDVRPHPHIGLATITYLFDGEIIHRDSLGFVQPIRPGAVNLMTAGRGIVHSERSGDDRAVEARLHGLQLWIALPDGAEETEPSFLHYPAEALPALELGGTQVRVVMGRAYGHASPVACYSPTLYLDARLAAGAAFEVPTEHRERAAYVVSGAVDVEGEGHCSSGVMIVARPGARLTMTAKEPSRVVVIGGEPVGPRHIWWNFVSSSKSRIEQAKEDWRAMRFGTVPGDDERIPLPDGS